MKVPEPLAPKATGHSWPHAEIERATSDDQVRPSVTEPYLRREDKQSFLYATDSYILARIPVEADGEADGYVPAEVLKAARKRNATLALHDGKAVVEQPGRRLELDRPELGEFPGVAMLIPEHRTNFTVAVNVDHLVRAARALGAKGVRLFFTANPDGSPKALSPIIVEPIAPIQDGRVALVMPIRMPREGA